MTITEQDSQCLRCHARPKLFETFKACASCSRRHCQQCWAELQLTNDHQLLMDVLPKINVSHRRRLCPSCLKVLLGQALANVKEKKTSTKIDGDEEYQLALAMSLSQNEEDEQRHRKKRRVEEPSDTAQRKQIEKSTVEEAPSVDHHELLLDTTTEAIERFMNRAKSNYQRNRDVIGDTALLSAFISLQTCASDLESLKLHLDRQRQHFETLQEKLTALRDAREALTVLRYEHQEKKRREHEQLDQQRRLMMMQKVADLRQFKHQQLANFQESYFQRLLDDERQITELLQKQKLFKEEQFGPQ